MIPPPKSQTVIASECNERGNPGAITGLLRRLRLLAMTGVPLVAALLVLSGCAYKYTTTFTVLNASSQTITVRVSEPGSDGGVTEFTLEAGRRRNIFTDSNNCPENYMPANRYNDDEKLPPADDAAVLEIWAGGRKLSDDVRMCEHWHYFSTDYMEKYTLSVTDEVIAYYSKE